MLDLRQGFTNGVIAFLSIAVASVIRVVFSCQAMNIVDGTEQKVRREESRGFLVFCLSPKYR